MSVGHVTGNTLLKTFVRKKEKRWLFIGQRNSKKVRRNDIKFCMANILG